MPYLSGYYQEQEEMLYIIKHMMVDLYSYKSFSNTFFGYYHKRQFQKVFWKKNILKRYSYTTAPTSKSKTKNYRLLTGAHCAPHRLGARPE